MDGNSLKGEKMPEEQLLIVAMSVAQLVLRLV